MAALGAVRRSRSLPAGDVFLAPEPRTAIAARCSHSLQTCSARSGLRSAHQQSDGVQLVVPARSCSCIRILLHQRGSPGEHRNARGDFSATPRCYLGQTVLPYLQWGRFGCPVLIFGDVYGTLLGMSATQQLQNAWASALTEASGNIAVTEELVCPYCRDGKKVSGTKTEPSGSALHHATRSIVISIHWSTPRLGIRRRC